MITTAGRPLWRAAVLTVLGIWTWEGAHAAPVFATDSTSRHSGAYALTHARLVTRPGSVIDDGVIVIRDGHIESIGSAVKIPADARVLDLAGRTVFAGFIDANSRYGQQAVPQSAPSLGPPLPGFEPESAQIRPEADLTSQLRPDAAAAEELRRLGFTSVASLPARGIFRGAAAVLTSEDATQLSEVLTAPQAVQSLAFDLNPRESDHYPMYSAGAAALIRQTFLDAQWYARYGAWRSRHRDAQPLPPRPDLQALQPALRREQPVFIQAKDELDFERAWRVADEFQLQWVIEGNGYEYRYATPLKTRGARVIVPLTWPQTPRVEDDDAALDYTLEALEHWQWAPFNARVLAEAGVPFALTAFGLSDAQKQFWPRVRESVARGLDESTALAALTSVPAQMLGLQDELGSLQPGHRAQLVVADADLFRSPEARIYEVWLDGQRHVLQPATSAAATRSSRTVGIPMPAPAKPPLPGVLRYPAGEFGRTGLPEQPQAVLVRGATIWTQGAQGRLEHADLLVERGRIRAVGQSLKAPAGAVRIDAAGLHVTPGLIDAHSHIALNRGSGYGEISERITAEVRNADILEPTDLAIYHQLADGVTAALLLQGAGNPINGQSQAIKLRWGADAEGLKIAGAPPSMKLGLGESPRQSSRISRTRYPLTRMGVNESLREAFEQARAYAASRRPEGEGAPQRRDLRLEAVGEILAGKSTMHVHSYRQNEVLALLRLSREYGVVPVFHHIVEGYKVADEMAALGAGASAFVDFWGIKWEADEATVYNAALMVRQGVLVSLSSDSASDGTGLSGDVGGPRLNLDAAYTVRFGGLGAEQALGLVTLNPARQMGLGDRIGSLEPGKEADFVLWSDEPLSSRAKVLQTWIDGRRYFDHGEDERERARMAAEQTRLIALARQLSAERPR